MTTYTENFTIPKRWSAPQFQRVGSPRAKPAVRARVAHTDGPRRKLDVYITEPVLASMQWALTQKVEVGFARSGVYVALRVRPAHEGLTLRKEGPRTNTARITISGAPLACTMCAKVRDVAFEAQDGALYALLPQDWFNLDFIEARCRALGVALEPVK